MDQIIQINLEHSYVKDRCYHDHADYKDCKKKIQQSINTTRLNKSNESSENPFGCGNCLKFFEKAVCAVNCFYGHGEMILQGFRCEVALPASKYSSQIRTYKSGLQIYKSENKRSMVEEGYTSNIYQDCPKMRIDSSACNILREPFKSQVHDEGWKRHKSLKISSRSKQQTSTGIRPFCSSKCKVCQAISKQQCHKFKCEMCPAAYKQRGSLTIHMRTHTSERLLFACDVCGDMFDNKRLKEHRSTHTKKFTCDLCNAVFRYRGTLEKHARMHSTEKRFICEVCSAGYDNRYLLSVHMSIHSGKRPFKCVVCHRAFRLKRSLKQHILIHTGERPKKCKICDSTCGTASGLTRHQLTHTSERPFKCQLCFALFKYPSSLRCHMVIHSDERRFECETCHAAFSRRDNLKSHMFIHTDCRPYTCSLCFSTFARSRYLKQHMFVHTGERLYKCDMCGKGFMRKGGMKRHIMQQHTGK